MLDPEFKQLLFDTETFRIGAQGPHNPQLWRASEERFHDFLVAAMFGPNLVKPADSCNDIRVPAA